MKMAGYMVSTNLVQPQMANRLDPVVNVAWLRYLSGLLPLVDCLSK